MEKVFNIFANDITCQTVVYRLDSCVLSFGIMLLSSEVRRFLLSSKSAPVIALGWMYLLTLWCLFLSRHFIHC